MGSSCAEASIFKACRVLLFCVSTVSNVCTIKGSVPVQAEEGLEPLHVYRR
jgi:hypothetical protein